MVSSQDDLGVVDDPVAKEHAGTLRFDRPTAEHLARKRFGEPVPDRERDFQDKMRGQCAKIDAAPQGVIAARGTIVMVDCQKFTGTTRFPESITSAWRQGGDVAVLVESWTVECKTILVRRQGVLDGKWLFSGELELFMVETCCMAENHVLLVSYVNMLAGYFHTNVLFRDPEICMWISNRRGVAYDESVSEYLEFVSHMSGPIGVFDVIKSDLTNFSTLMTNEQFGAVSARNVAGFEGLVLALKPDFAMRNGVVVFVTLWRDVYALRDHSLSEYMEALAANCVHRTLYDFERFLFDIKGSLCDLQSPDDIVKTSQMLLDYVSNLNFVFVDLT